MLVCVRGLNLTLQSLFFLPLDAVNLACVNSRDSNIFSTPKANMLDQLVS